MDPILIDWPERIETARLLLRVPGPGDGAVVHPSVCHSIEALNAWMPWAKRDYSLEDAESWCRRVRGEFHLRVQLQFIALDRASGKHLGNIGAFRFNWDLPSAEIGYWLRTDSTGQGLMTEAVRAISDHLIDKQGLKRIEIRCDEQNQRSARVAELAGYALQARLRCHARDHHGSIRGTRIYARIVDGQ